jgi:hypothetical protein
MLQGLLQINLASITVIIDAIEIIFERHQYGPNGIYNFAILRTYRKWMMTPWIANILNILFNYPHYIYLVSIQLIAGVLIVSHLFTNLSLPLVLVILLIHLLSHLRNQYGLDGSDQMQVIIFASLVAFYASPSLIVKQFSIFFICFQVLLSYFTSGFAKLVSPVWRNGTAISGILNTVSYGIKPIAKILVTNPTLSKLICWSVITFECAFPVLVFTGVKPTIIFIITGIVFHLSIAVFMRLNAFFWSFVATYPAVLFFAYNFQIVIMDKMK